jgi:two-component system, OmpR family, KDP operon response regulator KdpE
MPERPVVLVAATRPVVRRLLSSALKPRGFTVADADDEARAVDRIADTNPDVVLVEAERSSDGTAAKVRRLSGPDPVPIIVTGPNPSPSSVIQALDAGADDYVAQPFDPSELAARVRSLVRRHGERLATGQRRIGEAVVDLGNRRVTRDGRATTLARSEWRLLLCLLAEEGRPVSHDVLLAAAFGSASRGDVAALRAVVGRLRRKLGANGDHDGPIRAVRGLGYRLDARGRPGPAEH